MRWCVGEGSVRVPLLVQVLWKLGGRSCAAKPFRRRRALDQELAKAWPCVFSVLDSVACGGWLLRSSTRFVVFTSPRCEWCCSLLPLRRRRRSGSCSGCGGSVTFVVAVAPVAFACVVTGVYLYSVCFYYEYTLVSKKRKTQHAVLPPSHGLSHAASVALGVGRHSCEINGKKKLELVGKNRPIVFRRKEQKLANLSKSEKQPSVKQLAAKWALLGNTHCRPYPPVN